MKEYNLLSTELFQFCFYLIPSQNYGLSKLCGSQISVLAVKNADCGSENMQNCSLICDDNDLILTLNDFLAISIMFERLVKHHYLSTVVNPDFCQALVGKRG